MSAKSALRPTLRNAHNARANGTTVIVTPPITPSDIHANRIGALNAYISVLSMSESAEDALLIIGAILKRMNARVVNDIIEASPRIVLFREDVMHDQIIMLSVSLSKKCIFDMSKTRSIS